MIFTLLFSSIVVFTPPAADIRQIVAGNYRFEIGTYMADPRDYCSLALKEVGTPQVIRLKGYYKGEEMCLPRSAYVDLADVNSVRYKAGPANFKLIFHGGETSTSYTTVLTFRNGEIERVLETDGEFPKEHRTEIIYTNLVPPDS